MESELMYWKNHPLFREVSFEMSTKGIESIKSESFLTNTKELPYLPKEIPFKLLYMLGTYFADSTINTHRNFWVYVMMECDTKTYENLLKMHSKELREKISPVC